ncbi:MAG: penicillin-binding transpeptidase domain-containing protein, partial [Clostridia bacterium]
PGETIGVLASPEYKHSQSKEWTSTDTIQFSIGQSDNMFTTVQMAGYVSMIATNGKRYKTHIVKEIINPNTNEILLNKTPELVSNLNLKDSTINSIRNGMTLAISQGGSRKYFENCKVSVAGKTGTAEVFDGSSNGTFVCYAPIENPKIAIAITAEHIGEGSLLGSVAREVIDKYFETT